MISSDARIDQGKPDGNQTTLGPIAPDLSTLQRSAETKQYDGHKRPTTSKAPPRASAPIL